MAVISLHLRRNLVNALFTAICLMKSVLSLRVNCV